MVSNLAKLSEREGQIASLIAEDKSNAQIGYRLGITESTVKGHVTRIILKLGVESRIGVALAVVSHKYESLVTTV